MKSIIIELQSLASDNNCPLTTLLRKSLIVATKLNLDDFKKWINNELNGYKQTNEIPNYREVTGDLKVWNPLNGIWMSVIWEKMPKGINKRKISKSVSEIEDLLKNRNDKGLLTIPFTPEQTANFVRALHVPTPPTLIISSSKLVGILDTVRNVVLDWSLKLEADGILGKDLTFTEQEKQKISSITYNIQNFVGVLGDVKSEKIQIGDYNSIHSELKKCGVSQEERNELENILDELKNTKEETQKKSLLSKGMEWLKRNTPTIGALSEVIRPWIQNS